MKNGWSLLRKRINGQQRWIGLICFVCACVTVPVLLQSVIPSEQITRFEVPPNPDIINYYVVEEARMYALTQNPIIRIFGRIAPPSLVKDITITLDGEPYTETLYLHPEDTGGFHISFPLKPYRNEIELQGPKGSQETRYIGYLPEQGLDYLQPLSRTLSLNISPDQALVTYTTVYLRNISPRAFANLQLEGLGSSLFIKHTFYRLTEKFDGRQFSTLSPLDFRVDDHKIMVSAKGTLSGRTYTPANIEHILALTSSPAVPITVTLTLDRAELTALPKPWPPQIWRENSLQWFDPDQPILIEYNVGQRYPKWAKLWADSQVIIQQVNVFLDNFLPVVPLIPFIGLWYSLWQGNVESKDDDRQVKRYLLLTLILLMWIVPLSTFIIQPKNAHPDVSLWASSLTYTFLCPFIYLLSFPQKTGKYKGWLKWVLLILLVFPISVSLLWLVIPISFWDLFLMSTSVIFIWGVLLYETYNPTRFQVRRLFSQIRWLFVHWLRGKVSLDMLLKHLFRTLPTGKILLVWVVLLLALPIPVTTFNLEATFSWQLHHWRQFFFILAYFLFPYTVFAGLMPILKANESDQIRPCRARTYRLLGQLIFAIYLVGFLGASLSSSRGALFNFIPFFIAILWIYPYLIEHSTGWSFLDANATQKELTIRPLCITDLRQGQWIAKKNIRQRGKKNETARLLPENYWTRKAIFTFGPIQQPWENAKLSCSYALILSTILFLLYAPFILDRADQLLNTPFPFLQTLSVLILPFFAKWLLAAFLLGYFFPYIRGSNGLQKGIVLGFGIIVCSLPFNILLSGGVTDNLLALLWDAGQTLLFLSVLGLWAFDWNTARRYGLNWVELLSEQRLSFLLPYLSSVVAAISGAITSVITGDAETIIVSVLSLLLREGLPSL